MADTTEPLCDLTNHAARSGYLAQSLVSFQVRLASARSQDLREVRDLWLDRLDRDITEVLRKVDEANARISASFVSRVEEGRR